MDAGFTRRPDGSWVRGTGGPGSSIGITFFVDKGPSLETISQQHGVPYHLLREAFLGDPAPSPAPAPAPEPVKEAAKEAAAQSGVKGGEVEEYAEAAEKVAEAVADAPSKKKPGRKKKD